MKKFIAIICLISMLIALSACSANYSVDSDKNSYIPNNKNEINKIIYNTVRFNTNGGSYIEPISAKTISSIPTTTRNNYLFDGWYYDENFTSPISLPITISADITLHAKWLKLKDTETLSDTSIKAKIGYYKYTSYYITPSGFDLTALAQKGYNIIITVKYDVYYKKDYDVLWDIGYFGSPKYEASIYDLDNRGDFETDLKTYTSSSTRTLTYRSSAENLKGNEITLEFSTDNVQNIIYFENIIVSYECYK